MKKQRTLEHKIQKYIERKLGLTLSKKEIIKIINNDVFERKDMTLNKKVYSKVGMTKGDTCNHKNEKVIMKRNKVIRNVACRYEEVNLKEFKRSVYVINSHKMSTVILDFILKHFKIAVLDEKVSDVINEKDLYVYISLDEQNKELSQFVRPEAKLINIIKMVLSEQKVDYVDEKSLIKSKATVYLKMDDKTLIDVLNDSPELVSRLEALNEQRISNLEDDIDQQTNVEIKRKIREI